MGNVTNVQGMHSLPIALLLSLISVLSAGSGGHEELPPFLFHPFHSSVLGWAGSEVCV